MGWAKWGNIIKLFKLSGHVLAQSFFCAISLRDLVSGHHSTAAAIVLLCLLDISLVVPQFSEFSSAFLHLDTNADRKGYAKSDQMYV